MERKAVIRCFIAWWSAMCVPGWLFAQNLVPNGGFETYTTLPTGYAQLCKASGWTSASTACALTPGCGHPDYMHTAGGVGVQAPNTTFGSTMPHSGNGMIGFVTWYLAGVTNFREYPTITLTSPMVVGTPYTVAFWTTNTSNPYSSWGSNNLGVAFTMSTPTQVCGAPLTGIVPQLEITTIVYSTTWQLHTFTFTPTQAFTQITIGNFHNDAGTLSVQMIGTGSMGAYYFLDDVSVVPALPLPMELTAFSGNCEEDRTVLSWTTASETGTAHFEVQRSEDGEFWDPIGIVAAAGGSQQELHYVFADPHPPVVLRYYRIHEVDIDGAGHTGPTIAMQPCDQGRIRQQWILDAGGRICGAWPQPEGSLAPGVYLLRTEYEGGAMRTVRMALP